MDFELAPPIKAALHDAIERDDAGYLGTRHDGLLVRVRRLRGASARLDGRPGQVRVVTDVMVGVEELLLVLTAPGDGVIVNPPVYPPFFADIAHAGRRSSRCRCCATARWTSTGSPRRSPRARGRCCSATRTTRPGGC